MHIAYSVDACWTHPALRARPSPAVPWVARVSIVPRLGRDRIRTGLGNAKLEEHNVYLRGPWDGPGAEGLLSGWVGAEEKKRALLRASSTIVLGQPGAPGIKTLFWGVWQHGKECPVGKNMGERGLQLQVGVEVRVEKACPRRLNRSFSVGLRSAAALGAGGQTSEDFRSLFRYHGPSRSQNVAIHQSPAELIKLSTLAFAGLGSAGTRRSCTDVMAGAAVLDCTWVLIPRQCSRVPHVQQRREVQSESKSGPTPKPYILNPRPSKTKRCWRPWPRAA